MQPQPLQPLYVFLDESGNLDFSPSGTRYFVLTGVWLPRPFPCDAELHGLRFDLIESGLDIEYFHASDDRQATRDRVFEIIRGGLESFHAESLIVDKRLIQSALREEVSFYPRMLGRLLARIVTTCHAERWSELIVITDRIPVHRKRRAVEKAIRTTLAHALPSRVRHRILHHDSKSCAGLQIADYFNWAIYRAWDRNDRRSLSLIEPAVKGQIEACATHDLIDDT